MDKADIADMCKDLGFGGGVKIKLINGVEAAKAGGGVPASPPAAAPPPNAHGGGGGGGFAHAAPVTQAVVVHPGTPPPGMPVPPTYQPPMPTPAPFGHCPLCHSKGFQKAVYPGSPYCGKRCGQEAKAAGWKDGTPPNLGQPMTAVTVAGPPPGMCGFCGQKPVSHGHPYCGRGCGTKAKAAGMVTPAPAPLPAAPATPSSPHGTCAFCLSKPVSVGHPFCGGTCAKNAKAVGWKGGTPPGGAPQPTTPTAVAQPPLTLSPATLAPAPQPCPPGMCTMCHSKGFSKPVFDITKSPYCGRGCVGEAKAAGWVPGSPGIGSPAAAAVLPPVGMVSPAGVVSPAVTSPALATYRVIVPINPAAPGMVIAADLTVTSVTLGSAEDTKGITKGSKVFSVNRVPVVDMMGFYTEVTKGIASPVSLELTHAPVVTPVTPVAPIGGGLGAPPAGQGALPGNLLGPGSPTPLVMW